MLLPANLYYVNMGGKQVEICGGTNKLYLVIISNGWFNERPRSALIIAVSTLSLPRAEEDKDDGQMMCDG